MISERKLASTHTSFWHHAIPFADAFVRTVNLNLTRISPPFKIIGDPSRNALISELSFRLYAESLTSSISLDSGADREASHVLDLASQVRDYIARLPRCSSAEAISQDEIRVAFHLAARLAHAMSTLEPGVIVLAKPRFAGCGVISDCEGDLHAGTTLYEVKNVDRPFRSTDLRQLLSYCALNSLSNQHIISQIGLLNVRQGLAYRVSLDTLAMSAAGTSAAELLRAIVSYAMTDRPSS